ncbi:MAG: Na/Pi cotransporter family protein [Saprospiraceae bacterium]|nr:Na/Pi cotransporter family protein [Saprospiraceae bacterium]
MIMLENGFNAFVNGPLQKLLQRATNKLRKSLSLGFVVTALLQSSSLISVITISFISAGLIGLHAGIGIIFGANLGTTATAWLVSVFGLKIKVSSLAMPILAFGIVFTFQKSRSLKGIGNVLAGLGFFFLGIHFMKEGFDSYKQGLDLASYGWPGFWGLVVFTLLGIALTVILQSSSATMALILTALAAGQISYFNSLALAIGANVGTTITAILSALGANIAGKRLAGAHFVFNLVTGLVALIFITQIDYLVNLIAEKTDIAEDNYVLKLSVFHTLFNLLGVFIMVPFIDPLVRVLNRIFIEKPIVDGIDYPRYLNESTLAYPQAAFLALYNETRRLFDKVVYEAVAHSLNIHRQDIEGSEKLKKVVRRSREEIEVDTDELYYNRVKIIYSKIIKYATLIQSNFSLTPKANDAITHIKLANRNMVEVIKYLGGLQVNVRKYIMPENPYIQKEYDRLRKKVSLILREIHLTRNDEDPESHISRLEELKEKARKSDVLVDGSLDELIRGNKISSVMATSLANDSEIVAKITSNLVETAELLYINIDSNMVLTEKEKAKRGPRKIKKKEKSKK